MYITIKVFPTIRQVKLNRKKEFVVAALNLEDEIFIVYVASLAISYEIHFFYKAQIVLLKFNKALTIICSGYSYFADVFFLELTRELLEYTKINNQAIKLVDIKQSLYRLIYSLKLMKLEILKTYIKVNLPNKFIRSSKSPIDALIPF